MTARLTRTRFADGLWEGRLTGVSDPGGLVADLDGTALPDLRVTADDAGAWRVVLPIPTSAIGVAPAVIVFRLGEAVLTSLTLTATDADTDMQAEVALLRAEMDMLKAVLRQNLRASEPE